MMATFTKLEQETLFNIISDLFESNKIRQFISEFKDNEIIKFLSLLND